MYWRALEILREPWRASEGLAGPLEGLQGPLVRHRGALEDLEGLEGRTDGRTEILPCVVQDIVPFGSAALLKSSSTPIVYKAGQGYR